MVRKSLDYRTFTYKAQVLKYAADQNLNLFLQQFRKRERGSNEYKSVALYNASMLLYAVSVENLLKGFGLFQDRELIKTGNIQSYKDFMKRWKGNGNGHSFSKLIDFYKIEITEEENIVLLELQNFSVWAGRFPFPLDVQKIENFEKNLLSPGKLNAKYEKILESFFERFLETMNDWKL